jgi:hypothetical protein
MPPPPPQPPPLPPPRTIRGGWTPQSLQWAGRGYLSLAGGVLLLPILYFVLIFTAHRPFQILFLTACTFIPVLHGLNATRPPTPRRSHSAASGAALFLAFLTPFLAFWAAHPSNGLFAANACAHALAGLVFLVSLHLFVRAQSADAGDAAMRIEATSCLCLMALLPLVAGLCFGFLVWRGSSVAHPVTFHPALSALPLPLQAVLLFASLPYFVTLLMLLQASNHAFSQSLSA